MSGAVMIPLNEICAKFPLLTNVVDFRVGGQKSVYRATHPTYGEIALKLISPQTQFERIEREIEVVKRLGIANVPEIYETGYVDFLGGKIFFMLEQIKTRKTTSQSRKTTSWSRKTTPRSRKMMPWSKISG